MMECGGQVRAVRGQVRVGNLGEARAEYAVEGARIEQRRPASTEDHQHGKEGLDSWVTKTQRRDTLALYVSRLLQLLEALLPKATVVGYFFEFQYTAIGSNADL